MSRFNSADLDTAMNKIEQDMDNIFMSTFGFKPNSASDPKVKMKQSPVKAAPGQVKSASKILDELDHFGDRFIRDFFGFNPREEV